MSTPSKRAAGPPSKAPKRSKAKFRVGQVVYRIATEDYWRIARVEIGRPSNRVILFVQQPGETAFMYEGAFRPLTARERGTA